MVQRGSERRDRERDSTRNSRVFTFLSFLFLLRKNIVSIYLTATEIFHFSDFACIRSSSSDQIPNNAKNEHIFLTRKIEKRKSFKLKNHIVGCIYVFIFICRCELWISEHEWPCYPHIGCVFTFFLKMPLMNSSRALGVCVLLT